MQANNPTLGDDLPRDDDQSLTEHPTADSQEQPEMMAYDEQPQTDDDLGAAALESEAEAGSQAGDAGGDDLFAAAGEDAGGEEPAGPAGADEPDSDAAAQPAEDAIALLPSGEDEAEPDADEEETPGEHEDEAPLFRKGQIVDGTVLETSPTEVLVDLGEGYTGVVASRELERMDRAAIEMLSIGSPVTAFVLKARGADGRPVLSLARAEEEKNWRLAEEHYQNQEVYFSKVAGYNKGGLIVRFGKVRGFVPASQVSRDRQRSAAGESPEERWGRMVGEDIAVKVVEIDRARNRLILSERAAQREARDQQKSRLLKDLAVGDVRKGRVISVADFGAFVDLGGADGLVHLTEISWKHVTHPREALEVGQEVEVEIISVDPDRKRIGLSMKRREHDPWASVVAQYQIGQLAQATVTKLTKFGAFARLVDAPEIEGLIHISELADYRVSHPREVVLVGDVLTLRIVKIDREQRRLGLSLRQVDSAKYMDQDWQLYAEDYTGDLAAAETAPETAAYATPEAETPEDEAPVEIEPPAEASVAEPETGEVEDAPLDETPVEDDAQPGE